MRTCTPTTLSRGRSGSPNSPVRIGQPPICMSNGPGSTARRALTSGGVCDADDVGGNPLPRRGGGTADAAVLPRFHRADDDSDGDEEHRCSHRTEERRSCSVIRSAPMVPRNPYLLESEVFSTTLQDGNVVGNIYFGNYYIWQSRVRDKFLVRSQREAMAARGALGELRCVHTRVEHLREVMPFDDGPGHDVLVCPLREGDRPRVRVLQGQ